MTIDYLPPFFIIGGGSKPSSPRPQEESGSGTDINVNLVDTELEEFYTLWLPFNYGLNSEPE